MVVAVEDGESGEGIEVVGIGMANVVEDEAGVFGDLIGFGDGFEKPV